MMDTEVCIKVAITDCEGAMETRSVRFAPFASQIILAVETDAPSVESMWYSKDEMHLLVKADVDKLNARDSRLVRWSIVHHQDQDLDDAICERGLEMYMPGQLSFRQKRRKAFTTALLRKQQSLLAFYGGAKNDVAEALLLFAEARSKVCRDEAQSLGIQDALDAVVVEQDVPKATEHVAPFETSTIIANQVFTTVKNSTIIRAA